MLGDGDLKETQAVVESSSSNVNAELETPLSSVSAGRVYLIAVSNIIPTPQPE
jgi:hypothetical protein